MKGRYSTAVFFAIAILLSASISAYSKSTEQLPNLSPKHKSVKRTSRQDLKLNSAGGYLIRKGDTLWMIARAFGTTPEALKSANKLRSNKLKIGQELKIPVGNSATAKTESPNTAKASPAMKGGSVYPSISRQKDPNLFPDDGVQPRHLQIIKAGFEMLGVPYRYGGGSEKSGFDCSGLVKSLFSKFDIELPHSSREQFQQGEKVDRDELKAGDLVFFSSGGKQPNHVGIYIGNDKFLHAARYARQVVISDLNKLWYNVRYLGARRIVDLWGDEPSSEPQSD